jgi:hypothetical protein
MAAHGGAASHERMRILIANVTLAGRSGTETVVRDLSLGLKAAGHEPMVYSPALGELASEIAGAGIPVVSTLEAVPAAPDIVHGNHHVELVAALLRFPTARGLFVCHDRTAYWSAPPRMARIFRYVAVDRYCLARLRDDYEIPADRTSVIHNAVDTVRFAERAPLPLRPARAAVFSHYAGPDTHLEAVTAACDDLGIPLDVFGDGSGNPCAAPEAVLGRYDIVFAKARCALEAMAVGSAVVLCDAQGLGPMVTSEALSHLRAWNFGRYALRHALTPAAIVREVRRYDAGDAMAVKRFIREHANLSTAIREYVDLYERVMREPLPAGASFDGELHDYLRATASQVERLRDAVAKLRRPYRMEPLSDAAASCTEVTVCSAPSEIARNSRFKVRVRLENRGPQTLGSFPPFPVYLCYRWLDAENGRVILAEGPRSELRPLLHPNEVNTYEVGVVSPEAPGSFLLRITLVQEWVAWFDSLELPVNHDLQVLVR